MKLVFVDNLLFTGDVAQPELDLEPHLGLMSLVAVARSRGHEACIYDPKSDLLAGRVRLDASLYGDVAEAIDALAPDVVGFTTLGCNFHCVVRFARAVRRLRPDIPILLGGPHATILHREILEHFPEIDIVVRGEAEETLVELLPLLPTRSVTGVEGVSSRSGDGTVDVGAPRPIVADLDALPTPAYDCYDIERMQLTTMRIEAGRGCPFSCTFCSTASFFGRSYRLKSPDRLLAEMRHLHERYGATDFKLNHDLFTVNKLKVHAFCQTVMNEGFTWACSARVDCVDEALLVAMRDAGCRDIYFGIETGSVDIQTTSRKRLDLSLVRPTIDVTERLGIVTTTSFITGYPDESRADHRATLDMVGELHLRPAALNTGQLHLLTPEPGTRLIEELGSELRYDHHVPGFNFPHIDAEDEAMIAPNPTIFPNHFHYPTVLPRERVVTASALWHETSQFGRPLLRYLLTFFDGSFDSFADGVWRWRSSAGHSGPVSADELTEFFADWLRPGHHLVSLIRFSAALRTTPVPAGADHAPVDPDAVRAADVDARDVPLELGIGVVVLADLHDCVALHHRIATSSEPLDDSTTGERACRLYVRRASGVSGYDIDDATSRLVGHFEQPSTYWQLCAALAADQTAPLPAWDDIETLIESGVVQPAAERRQPVRTS